MNIIAAAEETLLMMDQRINNGYAGHRMTPEGEAGTRHLHWMLEEMRRLEQSEAVTSPEMREKLSTWLGYIQGAIVHAKLSTLADVKYINRRHR